MISFHNEPRSVFLNLILPLNSEKSSRTWVIIWRVSFSYKMSHLIYHCPIRDTEVSMTVGLSLIFPTGRISASLSVFFMCSLSFIFEKSRTRLFRQDSSIPLISSWSDSCILLTSALQYCSICSTFRSFASAVLIVFLTCSFVASVFGLARFVATRASTTADYKQVMS